MDFLYRKFRKVRQVEKMEKKDIRSYTFEELKKDGIAWSKSHFVQNRFYRVAAYKTILFQRSEIADKGTARRFGYEIAPVKMLERQESKLDERNKFLFCLQMDMWWRAC